MHMFWYVDIAQDTCVGNAHDFCVHNVHVLYVDNAQMAVVSNDEGPASSVTSGDDVVIVETLFNGTVNALKLELELLPAVGEVSPSHLGQVISRYITIYMPTVDDLNPNLPL